jgi:RNA polymerase sigma factor (sigma-70 family)
MRPAFLCIYLYVELFNVKKRKQAKSFYVAFHAPPEYQDLDAGLVHQDHLARLKTLLARLDPLQRELLALRFAAGLSTPQIALVVGKSPAAVKKQLTRLLHTLKEQYHEH